MVFVYEGNFVFHIIMNKYSFFNILMYVGSGKKQKNDADVCQIHCKKQACAIQWCLSRNNYQEPKCTFVINQYESCCIKVRKAFGLSIEGREKKTE